MMEFVDCIFRKNKGTNIRNCRIEKGNEAANEATADAANEAAASRRKPTLLKPPAHTFLSYPNSLARGSCRVRLRPLRPRSGQAPGRGVAARRAAYILGGTPIPSSPSPALITCATIAVRCIVLFFTTGSSMSRMIVLLFQLL